jgi:hypothetical protein
MPGKQTHPHLYDRLLAGGIQPEFPRPLPPSRTKPYVAAFLATLLASALLFAVMVAFNLALQMWYGDE